MPYTDYPITELGDTPGTRAPIRECRIISYDGDKYCTVAVCGVVTEIKTGYIYMRPGRCGDAPSIDQHKIALKLWSILK